MAGLGAVKSVRSPPPCSHQRLPLFFFLSRSANTTVDFDLEIAKKKSLDNPVFYVQYGHARLVSVLKKAETLGLLHGAPTDVAAWTKLDHVDELAISLHLS